MGAKTPTKLKLRRKTFKCDSCPKKFLSAQALKTHQHCVHKIKANAKQPKEKAKLQSLLGKPVKKKDEAQTKSVLIPKKTVRRKVAPRTEVGEPPQVSDVRKIEFECPLCPEIFSVYFSAVRHIQKFHCLNAKGEKVPSKSPDLIKPVRIELCLKCNKRVQPMDPHTCLDLTLEPKQFYVCLGCNQQFSSIQLFDFHITGLHCDDIETMFFPMMKEFVSWKEEMETLVDIKYLVLGKCVSKQIYRCTHPPDSDNYRQDDNIAFLCPSSMVVREYSKGIQVHYYKQHYGHKSNAYILPGKYEKYCITSLMKNVHSLPLDNVTDDDKDLYIQFKTLMNSIVVDSAKVNVTNLRHLIEKALEMTMILKQFDEEDDNIARRSQSKSMSDAEISVALESLQNSRVLRRNSTPGGERRKVETVTDVPVILNTFSMASEELQKNVEHVKDDSTVDKTTPHSFNDSYKDFVDRSFKATVEEKKPNKSKWKSKVEKKEDVTVEAATVNGNSDVIKHSDKKIKLDKKKVVKTRIGQFKPSISPKTIDKCARTSLEKLRKVDFEYEVKEQENDCNILILKIDM